MGRRGAKLSLAPRKCEPRALSHRECVDGFNLYDGALKGGATPVARSRGLLPKITSRRRYPTRLVLHGSCRGTRQASTARCISRRARIHARRHHIERSQRFAPCLMGHGLMMLCARAPNEASFVGCGLPCVRFLPRAFGRRTLRDHIVRLRCRFCPCSKLNSLVRDLRP